MLELFAMRRWISIVHHLPGRIRLRINPKAVTKLEKQSPNKLIGYLKTMPGIKAVRVNAVVGSAIIEYDAKHIFPDQWNRLFTGSDDEAKAIIRQSFTP